MTQIAEHLPDLLPKCGQCGATLKLRDGYNPKLRGNGHTREQQWCGVWYDHPPTSPETLCAGGFRSVLFPSAALLAQEAALAAQAR